MPVRVVSMVPARVDVTCYSGDRNRLPLRVVGVAGGPGLDVTGAEIRAHVRRDRGDALVVLAAEVEAVDVVAGLVAVVWDGGEVARVLAGERVWRGVWDVQITLPEWRLPVTPVGGSWTAVLDVTRVGAR